MPPNGKMILQLLRNRIDIRKVPFTERGSRLLVLREEQGLVIRLAEQQKGQGPPGDEHRLPAAARSLRPVDKEGTDLTFTVSTFPHLLLLQTSLGEVKICFDGKDTIVFQLPCIGVGLKMELTGDHMVAPNGGTFEGLTRISYGGDVPVSAKNSAGSGVREIELVAAAGRHPSIALGVGDGVPIEKPDFAAVLATAEASWAGWFEAAPKVSPEYRDSYYYAWWLMRANLLSPRGFLKREGMAPSKMKYTGVWHWDALFHALAYRHIDIGLAKEQIYLLLDHQQPDGMLPDVVQDDGLVIKDERQNNCPVTKPPLMGWVALQLFCSGAGRDFLAEIYEPLLRWTEWWFLKKNDTDDDGIPQYNHVWSSGLDDSPLWDEGMPVESPDLSTYLYTQLDSLAQIAWILGRQGDAVRWRQQAMALGKRLVEHFYDARSGVFWAQKEHRAIPTLTPFNLFPLWTGLLEPAQTASLLGHLSSARDFWTRYPIPTVGRSDPAYGLVGWRGPAWINVNYLVITALRRAGQFVFADLLTDRTLDMVARHDDIAEFYDPDTGEIPSTAAPGFGWSAALFIDLLLRREAERFATN